MIETERLILRSPTPSDRDALVGMFTNQIVMAEVFPGMDEAAADGVFARHDRYRHEGLGFWTVERRADGAVIGFCGFKRLESHPSLAGVVEAGWIIDLPYWRDGYAREAMEAGFRWIWDHIAEDRIYAITASRNMKSQQLMARLGMRWLPDGDFLSGSFPEGHRLRPTVTFAIDRAKDPEMTEIAIETERLILRGWRAGDVDPFHAMCSDPRVMATLGPLMTRDETEALIQRCEDRRAETGHCFWAIERRADGAFIGWCGAIVGNPALPIAGEIEIGWRIAADEWGKGYAREAAQATLDWIWANRDVPSVAAITSVGNHRSWGLMERLGMVRAHADDFDHPNVPEGSPLKRHVTYRISRPAV